MNSKKCWETLLNWAIENEKNKKQAIEAANTFINILNSKSKLSKADIKKIIGGQSDKFNAWL